MFNLILPLTGFEPRTSGIGSDRSTNSATTLTRQKELIYCILQSELFRPYRGFNVHFVIDREKRH